MFPFISNSFRPRRIAWILSLRAWPPETHPETDDPEMNCLLRDQDCHILPTATLR